MTDPTVDALAAIEMILTIHDGMQRMVREDGLPAEAIEPAHGFLAALADAGYVVVRAEDGKGLCDTARRFLEAMDSCRTASEAAIDEKGAAVAFAEGYPPLDAALVTLDEAEDALLDALATKETP